MAKTKSATKKTVSPAESPKKPRSRSRSLPVPANPYAESYLPPKAKASATFELFREAFYHPRTNLDPRGLDRLLEKYGKSTTWVYIAVRAISDACSQIPFQVRDITRDGESRIIRTYDLGLNRLLRQPNPYQRRFDFVEAVFVSLELTGNCFIEMVRDMAGRPTELYVLNASRVTIVPDPKQFIAGYIYTVNGRHIPFKAENVIHIKYHHPSNEYYGLSPLSAAEVACESDEAASEWNRNFLMRGSWPAGAIETENEIEPQEMKRLRRMIKDVMQQGADQAGRLLLLTGGLKYNPLAIKPKEADWLDARRMSRDEILSVFKVPYAVAGLFSTEQTTARSAGVEQQIKQFYRNTIFPKIEKFVEMLNLRLVPEFRQRYEITPNYRSVPALQDEVEQELTRAMALRTLVGAGVSLNKALARLYPDIDAERWGDVAWMNQAQVPVSGPENPFVVLANGVSSNGKEEESPPQTPAQLAQRMLLEDLGEDYREIIERVRITGDEVEQ